MHIKEFADLSGVSIRTLRYYDEIGLLKPASVDELTGYRYYNEDSVALMQEILFYRELGFSLKDIGEILASPEYDRQNALLRQKELLILKKERLERVISAVDGAIRGENIMKAFDKSKYESARKDYEREAKEKWGNTVAYKEYEEKMKSGKSQESMLSGLEDIIEEFAVCKRGGAAASSHEAQALAEKLQNYITGNFYTCTKQILFGLGQMYVMDERFKNNIDNHGEGTAEFMREVISIYCK